MKIAYFTHSLRSCWNHGNAHFQRGLLRALASLGHEACAFEPADGWSLLSLLQDQGEAGLAPFHAAYPDLDVRRYAPSAFDPEEALADFELVVVHEWTDPSVIGLINRARARGARFRVLFHDTHHRAVTSPDALAALDLSAFDGVLAFGASLADLYRRMGWGARVFVWHEAADDSVFQPRQAHARTGLVWVGNWGDDERSAELEQFLLAPAAAAGLALDVHGVRYPAHAQAALARHGARYRGWLANPEAPEVYRRKLATIHVPRGPYARALPGVPTIRMFEALACGIPLLSAPWDDCEGLFRPGEDYLQAKSGEAMTNHLRALVHDASLRQNLSASGLSTIRARHTCNHRARELLAIARALDTNEEAA